MSIASDEYQTPKKYIKAAIEVMGSIDLDPACSISNSIRLEKIIPSSFMFITKEQDGLKQKWFGNVWLNPPYSKPNLTNWSAYLILNYVEKQVNQSTFLVPSYTSESWYHNCLRACSAICLPNHRINFLINRKIKDSPRFANTFFYFGNSPTKFIEVFSKFGKCFLNK